MLIWWVFLWFFFEYEYEHDHVVCYGDVGDVEGWLVWEFDEVGYVVLGYVVD